MPLQVALTGGIGSGKTFISCIFSSLGVPVFYADDEVKKLYQITEVIHFVDQLTQGVAIEIAPDGSSKVSLEKLANLIFQSSEIKEQLESFIHPLVRNKWMEFCLKHAKKPYLLAEAALYIESGQWKYFDVIILVTAPLEVRLKRLQRYRGLSLDEAIRRISAQWSDEKKIPYAHYVIHNDGSSDLTQQIKELHIQLLLLSKKK